MIVWREREQREPLGDRRGTVSGEPDQIRTRRNNDSGKALLRSRAHDTAHSRREVIVGEGCRSREDQTLSSRLLLTPTLDHPGCVVAVRPDRISAIAAPVSSCTQAGPWPSRPQGCGRKIRCMAKPVLCGGRLTNGTNGKSGDSRRLSTVCLGSNAYSNKGKPPRMRRSWSHRIRHRVARGRTRVGGRRQRDADPFVTGLTQHAANTADTERLADLIQGSRQAITRRCATRSSWAWPGLTPNCVGTTMRPPPCANWGSAQ